MSNSEPTGSGISQSTYDLLQGRLRDAANELASRARNLNQARLDAFGSSQLALLGTERVRTEANSIPRDVVSVGDQLIVAYNPVVGISGQPRVEDVFAAHHLSPNADGGALPEFSPVASGGSVLDDDQFRRDVDELYTYFKESRLQQLYRSGPRLLAVFRTGGGANDVRVLRWQIDPDQTLRYLDARGDRDHRFPSRFDAEFILATRSEHVGPTTIKIGERVLVDPLGGSFDVRLDDGGQGSLLLSDPLQHSDQSLQDAQLRFAFAGDLVLLDLLPYGETQHRYYVVNLLAHTAERIDSIGQAFRQLPEGQGLIFPQGIYLRTGELRRFDLDATDMELLEVVRSPNGEDMLYVFHEREGGRSILLPYNVVRQEVSTPLWCHGHTIFEDGTLVLFREEVEPTRIHPIQVWTTPFVTDEWYAAQPRKSTPLDRIGNPSLVAGIADGLGLTRLVEDVEPSTDVYADLLASTGRFLDNHHWLGSDDVGNLAEPAHQIRMVAEQVIDEFERTLEVQAAATEALSEARTASVELLEDLRLSPPKDTAAYIDGLAAVRHNIGHLHTVRERREIDIEAVDALIAGAETFHNKLAQSAASHLAADGAFQNYHDDLAAIAEEIPTTDSSVEAREQVEAVDALAASMDVVAGTVGDLVVDDPRIRTSVLEQVSGVLAEVNSVRVAAVGRLEDLIQSETGAAFSTELGLFGQSIATAVSRADTPEACDDALARLLLQLEQLETAGPRTDAQIEELNQRRDRVTETLSSRRQQLVDVRQQKSERLVAAADRTLIRVTERAAALESVDDINGFFAADPMVARVRSLVDDLRELGEPVRADEMQSRLGSSRDRAARALRDRQDLFDGDLVKLGRHRFSLDGRSRELTVVPTEDHLDAVLTGTDLRMKIQGEGLDAHRDLWTQPLASETPDLYRSTFLACDLLLDALNGERPMPSTAEERLSVIRSQLDDRLDEGYDRGVHDVDAGRILDVLAPLAEQAGTLTATGPVRAEAQLVWASTLDEASRERWLDRGRAAASVDAGRSTRQHLAADLASQLGSGEQVADYLIDELCRADGLQFALSGPASAHVESFRSDERVATALADMDDDIDGARTVLTGHVRQQLPDDQHHLTDEIVMALLTPDLPRRIVEIDLTFTVDGLAGRHPTIVDGVFSGHLDELLATVSLHRSVRMPAHREFGVARRNAIQRLRSTLRVDDLEPRVPEGFVRNQLIDRVYLPLIGDNLSRQIGTVDDVGGARSGLLMLLSPPGYGKTTLVEYIADRLGMALVKVSGPGLGHEVTSLDPAQAPSATAAREIERINLAFAMGTNVILYLDDIQHTNPEFLQRFISLCDAQRRVEGVWDGESRSFDLRGKRFAVVMAGNPYTESGERFRVPDMLANRADTYNLGDVLSNDEDVFARSYLENALTANPVLAPLVGRDQSDVEQFFRAAGGEPLGESNLTHGYSSAEVNDIVSTLRHLITIQEAVLVVNRNYIASAATADEYRTEPPFLLQGSYRNMARMTSKLIPAMTDDEVERVLDEHYVAESQALTGAAEWNLLKLAEIRGRISDEQIARRDDILTTFRRKQRLGGDDRDPATRVVAAIEQVADALAADRRQPVSQFPAPPTDPRDDDD